MSIHKYKGIIRYALYDAGNSNYATLIPSVAFPVYFKTVVASQFGATDAIWGAMIMASTATTAFYTPNKRGS